MPDSSIRRIPFLPQVAVFTLMILSAGLLATSAYTRDTSGTVAFTCDDGDRFVVEYLENHVRLRHGSGIFALSREASGEPGNKTYSDGNLTFRSNDRGATLALPGVEARSNCVAEATTI